jgi:cellobiose phosphorylase
LKYGNFSSDGLEYVVSTPNTPRPWINYLTNEKYCAIISQTAGGYSFVRDCRSGRITRWLPENWHFDRPGRYIFAKEIQGSKSKAEGSKRVWSLTYQPLRVKPDFYECRHGLGYTQITTKYFGIHSQITYFVPREDNCEVWLASITNNTKETKTLELSPYMEWLVGDYHLELRYRNIMNLYNRIWFSAEDNIVLAQKTAEWGDLNIKPFTDIAFFSSSLPVKGHAVCKDTFLGRFNTEENPEAIISDGPFKNSSLCSGEDGIACLQHRITLKPGETKEFAVTLGQAVSSTDATRITGKYKDVSIAAKELDEVKALWRRRIIDNIKVQTPDKDFDLMMNIWVKYQLYICNFWSRSPSFYHEGSGGRGFRDSCQDGEAIVSINPELTRKRILVLASLIRKDGTSAPGFSDSQRPQGHRPNKDHPVWLTITVGAYIQETGDEKILLKELPYLKDHWIKGWEIDKGFKGHSRFEGKATLFEHLKKNLDFTYNDVGKRGFPLIGHADWNDAIDAAGIKLKGESVWLAQALVRSLKELSKLALLIGKEEDSKELSRRAEIMAGRINKHGWDGDWYTRGFTDCGSVYGSKENKEGKIYLNSQSWAILSGVAEGERLKKVLSSVNKYLDGEHGLALFYPAYSKFDSRLGRISMFAEGTKENAAVFCHAATFMAAAFCVAGQGRKAYEAMKKIMPNAQADYDVYKTEPYAYAEYLVGPEHPYLYGEGAFTWITGTAGWNFMSGCEYLLGVRREINGLRIDPCIPEDWKGFKVRRPYRGSVYEIEVKNPHCICRGVKEVSVDRRRIEGNLLPVFSDGKVHKVEVIMG